MTFAAILTTFVSLPIAILAVLAIAGSNTATAATQEHCQEHIYNEGEIVVFASVVDCNITIDTGYTQGEPFDIDVVQLDGKAVEVNTANAFLVMQAAAEIDGIGIGIVSGFRSFEEQEYLYACYVNCNCNNCNLAARPGFSNHNSGHALDLNASAPGVYDWLAANAGAFGFERTVPSENWHWEWWGGGPGGGECMIAACPEVPADGRIVEETDVCFVGGGKQVNLRDVEAGHAGSLLWTKATDSTTPSNYAIWKLNFAQAGRYELAVFLDDGQYGQSKQAAYVVNHAGDSEIVVVDQQSTKGWLSLGVYEFAAGADQSVRLDDNTGEPWADDPGGVRLLFDALQVVPEGVDFGEDDENEDEDEDDDITDDDPDQTGDLIGGCSSSSSGGSFWFVLLMLALLRRRISAS